MKSRIIETKLGQMVAIGDENHLYLLQFVDRRGEEGEISSMEKKYSCAISSGRASSIDQIEDELNGYFSGALLAFSTPVKFAGTPFQQRAWEELMKVPYGSTRSYKEQAANTGNEKAFRAVANANSINPLGIIVPCHRIVNHNGKLGGYGGGIDRKQWLLDHEKLHKKLSR